MTTLSDKAAIVGIGATDFSKDSGRSELRLAVEAITAALDDAGLSRRDVDGLCSLAMDTSGEAEVARALGCDQLRFFSRIGYGGGGGVAPIMQAAMAVATGVAHTVVCYRAMNERSQYRFGTPRIDLPATGENAVVRYHGIHGLVTAAARVAMSVRRYMHETGATAEDFAHLAVATRKHASTNPAAFFYGRPISFDDYMASPMIADPFRLLDCCQESDGGVAVVVTSLDRARSLRQVPVSIRAAAQGSRRGGIVLMNYYDDDPSHFTDVKIVADQMYAQAGLSPADIQTAVIYDHFLPTVFNSLEAYGFCQFGEAKDFVKGGNIAIGGGLPINTHGGQVGEAYVHGMNGVAEAVRQVRGTAINQVPDVQNVVVTGASGDPTSGLILGRDVTS